MNNLIKEISTDAALRHITAQVIADQTGLDRKTVAGILSGETENPKIETLQAIAGVLQGEIVYSTPDSKQAVRNADVSYYRALIGSLRTAIAVKDKWLRWLFVLAVALAAANIITAMIAFAVAAAH